MGGGGGHVSWVLCSGLALTGNFRYFTGKYQHIPETINNRSDIPVVILCYRCSKCNGVVERRTGQ